MCLPASHHVHHPLCCCCRSHKGSNLALMVELLAGPLVGAAVADKLEERNWGNLVLVIDPSLLGEPDVIKARTQVSSTQHANRQCGWLVFRPGAHALSQCLCTYQLAVF